MKYYRYEEWQLKKHINDYFIIVTGPRWTGKSYFIREFMKRSNLNYIIIDAFKAWKEKKSWLERAIINDTKKSLRNRAPVGVITSFRNVEAENFDNFRSFLRALKDETYVIIDHADYLRYARGIDFREVAQEWIDKRDKVHFVFVAKGTPALLSYLGPQDPQSPLFMRYEKYVEVVELSPNETIKFLEDFLRLSKYMHSNFPDGFETYQDIGGLRGYLKKFVEVGCNEQKLRELLRNELKEEIRGKNTWRVLEVIARYTRIYGYADKKIIEKKVGKNFDNLRKSIEESLINNGLVMPASSNTYKTPKILAKFLPQK
ncbi:ATPase [Thermococcus gammatolerans]|uniref:Prokaryotic ATPase, AAA superfamily n=1 Tax=Thermococcus gammatolerans (strain DSM 15229 / JCM 11827 / EJ3) TaxID=593117 RepID=C5A7B0_THEGJ|nr:ATPase [Thermococcus gammatolerans]ACS34122.1 Prokaryotic ATPase, AAA superfamily [Thermococcus gammatolerans EJ3]